MPINSTPSRLRPRFGAALGALAALLIYANLWKHLNSDQDFVPTAATALAHWGGTLLLALGWVLALLALRRATRPSAALERIVFLVMLGCMFLDVLATALWSEGWTREFNALFRSLVRPGIASPALAIWPLTLYGILAAAWRAMAVAIGITLCLRLWRQQEACRFDAAWVFAVVVPPIMISDQIGHVAAAGQWFLRALLDDCPARLRDCYSEWLLLPIRTAARASMALDRLHVGEWFTPTLSVLLAWAGWAMFLLWLTWSRRPR